MEKKFRNRRDLATQLGGIIYATEALLSSKGRFRGQFDKMDRVLQRDFFKLLGFTQTLKIKYENYLIEHCKNDMPDYLKKHYDFYRSVS